MSDPSSSKPTREPSPNRDGKKKDTSSDKSEKPPVLLQTLIPTMVSVKSPAPADCPLSTCISWNQSTFRSRSMKRQSNISVCWTRIPRPESSPRSATRPGARLPTLTPTIPASLSESESESSPSANSEDQTSATIIGAPPTELPFFRGVLLNIHVADDAPPHKSYTVTTTKYPNGALKGVAPDNAQSSDDFKETLLGYEWRDPAGIYHYYVPMGYIHHKVQAAAFRSLQSIYTPAYRLGSSVTDRIHKSYSSGKQYEAWDIIWNRVSRGEPLALGHKLLGQVSVMAERSKEAAKREEEERAGRGKDGPTS